MATHGNATTATTAAALNPACMRRRSQRSASHNARKKIAEQSKSAHYDAGVECVGRSVSMQWPPDGKFYRAYIVNYDNTTGHHLICYEVDHSTEQVQLADRIRSWKFVESPPPKRDDAFIGKIVYMDPCCFHTFEEVAHNIAFVLDTRTSTRYGTRHVILFITDCYLTCVNMTQHDFVIFK